MDFRKDLEAIRERHRMRVASRCDEDEGRWITTKTGKKIHLNEKGEPDKGNPNVIAVMNGEEPPKKKSEPKSGTKSNASSNGLYSAPKGFQHNFSSAHGVKYPTPRNGAYLDTDSLSEVERLATTEEKNGKVVQRSPEKIRVYKEMISSLSEDDYVYMKDPATGRTVASVPGISQRVDTVVTGRSEECQRIYDSKVAKGKRITDDMVEISNSIGSRLMGLENCYKGASSCSRKINTKRMKDEANDRPPKSDEEYISGFGDVVRYTVMSDHRSMVNTVNKTIDSMKKKGYDVVEVDNKWTDPNSKAYHAVHLAFRSPDGETFEVQVHSAESMKVKNKSHAYYEQSRKYPEKSAEHERNKKLSEDCWKTIAPPDGIDRIKSYKA